MAPTENFEVIIVGGSYAGLSAALALGRSLRQVLLLDSGLPCNRQTPHSHNFLTHDGQTPAAIAEKAKAEVLQYDSIRFRNDLVLSGEKTAEGFSVTTRAGKRYHSKKLIFATGIRDLMPEIKGFAQCWGISVIHCPYCHGYEARGRKTAIFGNGEKVAHFAGMVLNLTSEVSILTSGKADFEAGQLEKFRKHGIEVIEDEVRELVQQDGQLEQVVFANGRQLAFETMYASLPFEQHCDLPERLGCALTPGGHLQVDEFQKTTVEGVYACGDNSAPMRSLATAVYTGNLVGAMVNSELCQAEF